MKENITKNKLIKQKFRKEIPKDDNRERTICDNCEMIFYENPKVVAGCLLTWEGKILLCKRATEPRSGYWTLPAGFMENNETVLEGALRETEEEAGAQATNVKLFLICNLPHISQIYMMHVGELVDGKYSAGIESLEVKLFDKNDIPWDELAFTVIEKTLKYYFNDNQKGEIGFHIDTIDKK